MSNISQEEIQKALHVLGLKKTSGNETSEDIRKGLENELSDIDKQILELQNTKKQKEVELSKSTSSTEINQLETSQTSELIKSMQNEFNGKIDAFSTLIKSVIEEKDSLKQQNDLLRADNETILKSISAQTELLQKAVKQIEEIANSPVSKLGAFSKAIAVDRFAKPEKTGENDLSLKDDKKKVLGLLEKSLNPDIEQRDLYEAIQTVENGFVDPSNFGRLKKSIESTIGTQYNIIP